MRSSEIVCSAELSILLVSAVGGVNRTMDSHPSPLAQVVQTHKVDKPTVRVYYTETMTGVDVAPLHSLIMGLALVCAGLLSCSSSFWRACSCSLRCLFAPLGLELRPYNLDRPRVHPRRANPESP